jgi:hypothetical protein
MPLAPAAAYPLQTAFEGVGISSDGSTVALGAEANNSVGLVHFPLPAALKRRV